MSKVPYIKVNLNKVVFYFFFWQEEKGLMMLRTTCVMLAKLRACSCFNIYIKSETFLLIAAKMRPLSSAL